MDTLLRGTQQTPVIPFDLSAPVLLYPVRHHSPACAWHLERTIERYEPDCILVEGPENANELLPVLTSPDTRAPVALYYAWRDKEGRLSEQGNEATFRCYYPFLDQSPELVALRAAAVRGIPGRFIDLPYAQILLATGAARGLREEMEKPNYASDVYLAANQFQKILCEKAGLRDFEEFWEKYFETAGPTLTTEAFVGLMNRYCQLARQSTPAQQLREDGCLAREAHMAKRIREAAEQYRRVLVVTGGFHIEGLLHPEQEALLPALEKNSQSVYPMRYSLPAADALSGYASGMPGPGYYADVWAALHTETPEQAWERVTLDYLVRTGRRLRKNGDTLSAYDETCALQQARMLAQLRDKPAPGLYELRDVVLSSFVKGEADGLGSEPLRALQELTTGKTVGHLCAGAPVPPLVQDFEAQCRALRLRRQNTGRQETVLSVFSSPRHRAISRFFYQTIFLDCGFARRTKGPDLRRRRDRNLIREIWEYRWSVNVETALIEHAVSGATLQDACAAELRQRMAKTGRAAEGADLLVQGFLMGLSDTADTLVGRMDELLIADGDFASLCDACAALNGLEEWQSQYGERGNVDYPALLARCFARILQMLPAMNTVDDRAAPQVQRACMLLYQVTGRESFAVQRAPLLNAFSRLVRQDPLHPALHGAVLGLLYGSDPGWKADIDRAVRGYLQGTHGMMLRSAAFLQGLFSTGRDLLLTDDGFQRQVDRLLCELSEEDFTALLPELRLAFSYFVPMETDRIARQAAALHGKQASTLRRQPVDPGDYARAEAVDAWAAARLGRFFGEGEEEP